VLSRPRPNEAFGFAQGELTTLNSSGPGSPIWNPLRVQVRLMVANVMAWHGAQIAAVSAKAIARYDRRHGR
jgi:hypothetical protein